MYRRKLLKEIKEKEVPYVEPALPTGGSGAGTSCKATSTLRLDPRVDEGVP